MDASIFQVIEGCTVTNIGTDEYTYGTKTIKNVTTSHGTIKTNVVINCTGAWANRITNMVILHCRSIDINIYMFIS